MSGPGPGTRSGRDRPGDGLRGPRDLERHGHPCGELRDSEPIVPGHEPRGALQPGGSTPFRYGHGQQFDDRNHDRNLCVPDRFLTSRNHITSSNLLKDFASLFSIKSGKFVNWNQQSLNALASDLGFGSPSKVAPRLTASKPVLAAQVIDGSPATTGATVQPAPVPEPASLIIFAMALGGLAIRTRFGQRKPARS